MLKTKIWRIAYWVLLVCWITGAGLFMASVNGGFLTNYLSDLAFPPWFYISIRGLQASNNRIPRMIFFGDWFGRTSERALISILLVGILTEVKTYYWPGGIISGTFDPMDIVAYGIGLLVCYGFDKWSAN